MEKSRILDFVERVKRSRRWERLETFWGTRWLFGPGGCIALFSIALPLVFSQESFTIGTVLDRIFLSRYSPAALSAATDAQSLCFVFLSVWCGVLQYTSSFISQANGAKRHDLIGRILWHSLIVAICSAFICMACYPLTWLFFHFSGHEQIVIDDEIRYCQIMMGPGSFLILTNSALQAFFTGRGSTLVVFFVNAVMAVVNVFVDWLLIYGKFGLPAMGVSGAALAKITAQASSVLILTLLIFSRWNNYRKFKFSFKVYPRLLFRLVRMGLANGLQMAEELLAWTVFLTILGRVGTDEMAASSIALNLNQLFSLPVQGICIGIMVLIGQYHGGDNDQACQRVLKIAVVFTLLYMILCSTLYLVIPNILIYPYVGTGPEYKRIIELSIWLMVAVYSSFDAMTQVFAYALKGAGDPFWPVLTSIVCGWIGLLLPVFLLVDRFHVFKQYGIYGAWGNATLYSIVMSILQIIRWIWGKWKGKRLIKRELLADKALLLKQAPAPKSTISFDATDDFVALHSIREHERVFLPQESDPLV